MKKSTTYSYLIQLLALLLICVNSLPAEISKINIRRQYPKLRTENKLWFGHPSGLYQYQPDDDAFKKFSIPLIQPQKAITQLFYNDEWLWCVLDVGLAALHTRLNTWYYFDSTNGLPSNSINGLAFEEDYLWVATNQGAARFDLLIEEWEKYDANRGLPFLEVKDILVYENRIWMVGDQMLSEYDPGFEKWRHFKIEEDSTISVKRLFLLRDEIWIVSDKGLIRFSPVLQSWQRFYQSPLQEDNLIEIFLEDTWIWAMTRHGFFYYDQASGVWREFEGNNYLRNYSIRDGAVTSQSIWILAEENVFHWRRNERIWDILDYASGLSSRQYQAIHSDGDMTFLIHTSIIDYQKSELAPWRTYTLERETELKQRTGRQIFKNLLDNQSGGFIPLGKYRWSWEGTRAVVLEERQYQSGDGNVTEKISGNRLDLKSQIDLQNSRNVSGFYNNTDFSEVMYGIRYRSRTMDLLQEFNWGDFQSETGSNPFAASANIFGSQIWLQAGRKTPRFKRSFFTVKAFSGEQQSQRIYEYKQGASQIFLQEIRDVDYLKNQFFYIPHYDTLASEPDFVEIYVDDLNPQTNTPNTLMHSTIAGLVGDFDLWKPTEDYYLYRKINAIRMLTFLAPSWIVVIRYRQEGILKEGVLQQPEGISSVQKNVYSLGGQKIIPQTFHMKILDSLQIEISLDEFGLDENGDGQVDSRWIDYNEGLLIFPSPYPFPASVYDPQNPLSWYRLHFQFETELPGIQLKHNDLVRGSETVWLDGRVATGGNDYVIDYTNGSLIFVREGIVNPDTRIEIEYEYFIDQNDQVHSAGINISPSDNFYIQGNWQQISPEQIITADTLKKTDLFSVHGEFRNQFHGIDLRLIPGLAYHPGNNQPAGSSIEGLLSSSRFRLQSSYQYYAQNYRSLYRPQSLFGIVKNRLQFFATVDATDYLRLTGEWRKQEGFATLNTNTPIDLMGSLSLLFYNKNWPALEGRYNQFQTQMAGNKTEKYFWESRLEYQLSDLQKHTLFLSGFKLESLLRLGQQESRSSISFNKQKFNLAFIRLNALISQRFQAGIFYRRRQVDDISDEFLQNPFSQSERMLLDLSHEEWRLLQINVRLENNLNQFYHSETQMKDINLRHFSQFNLRFFPGNLWQRFSSLSFEATYNRSLSGSGTLDKDHNNFLWWVDQTKVRQLTNSQLMENFYLKNEFRPSAWWFLYSMLEYSPQENRLSGSSLNRYFWRWSEKLDMRLGWKTHLILQYRQFYQDIGFDRRDRYHEPSVRLEHRFTQNFLNIANLLYRRRRMDDRNLLDISDRWEGRYDIIWRLHHFLKIRYMEIRQSLSVSYLDQVGYNLYQQWQMSSSTGLDLYPLHSLIIRLRTDWNALVENQYPERDFYSLLFSLKVSLRL